MKSFDYYIGGYFKNSVNYLIKSFPIFFIFTVIDCIEIWISDVKCAKQLFNVNNNIAIMNTDLAEIIKKISPYEYFAKYMGKENENHGFNRNHIVILVYAFSFIWFGVYILLRANNDSLKSENLKRNIFDIISINYFNYFLFRFAQLYCFDTIFREIVKIVYLENPSIKEMIILFVLTIFIGAVIFVHIIIFSRICLYCNFNILNSQLKHYPYDYFSAKFDLFNFVTKTLMSLNQNYAVIIASYILNYTVLFCLYLKYILLILYIISLGLTIFQIKFYLLI